MKVMRVHPAVARELASLPESGEVRVLYFVKLADTILVFHAFRKKTQSTAKAEINTAQKRLKRMLEEQ